MKEQFLKQNFNPETKLKNIQELTPVIMNEAERYEIKPEDRNEKGELLVSPDGPISNLGKQNELWWKIARTESFLNWFGDWKNKSKDCSKIVDVNGEPLALFRGVKRDISISDFYNKEFYDNKINYGALSSMGPGVYFTPVPETADNSAFRKGSVFAGFAVAKRPKYKKNLLDIINHDEVNKIVSLLLPKKIIDKLPETSLFNFNYDSSFGGSTDPEKPLDLFKFPKHTRVEEMVNVVLNDPQQVLIIPSPIQKIDKPVKDWDT